MHFLSFVSAGKKQPMQVEKMSEIQKISTSIFCFNF